MEDNDTSAEVAVAAASDAQTSAMIADNAAAAAIRTVDEATAIREAAIVETAETLVALANTQAALANTQAAEVIVEAEQAIAANEGSLEWLSERVKAQEMEMTRMRTLLEEMALAQLAANSTPVSEPSIPEPSENLPMVDPVAVTIVDGPSPLPLSGEDANPDKPTSRKTKKIRFL